MTLDQLTVATIFVATVFALIKSSYRATQIFTATLVVLFFTGLVTPEQSLLNAVNPGVATLVALLLASRALEKTTLLKTIARNALSGGRKSIFH